jgi:hypothetical protein
MRRSRGGRRPFADHYLRTRELIELRMGVRRYHDRASVVTSSRDRLPQSLRTGLIEIRERLIEEKERDAFRLDARKGSAASFASGEVLDRTVHVRADTPAAERPVDSARVPAAESSEELEILSRGQPPQQHRPMSDVEEIARHSPIATRERYETGESSEERCLPGAVRAAHERQSRAHYDGHRAEDRAIVENDRGIVERCA